jgi:geranylgeranyl transferase type-2 subunit beta
MTYLIGLTTRLLEGAAGLPRELRARQADYLAARQNPDGGFSGREGDSDLYYTGFGLRGLAVLEALTPDICNRAAGFLRRSMKHEASVVDFFSLLYSCFLVKIEGPDILAECPPDWSERVAATLESFRTPDGGYGKAADAASGSTYHTFLVGLCYQLLGQSYPRPEEVERFVSSRQREDGGFVEIAPMRRGGANPTAAAVGAWQIIRGFEAAFPDKDRVVQFLTGLMSPEGGLCANTRMPVADLLSTFTGCWTLEQLGAADVIPRDRVREYAESLESPGGGFGGGIWDETTDVEYTFYGLGTLALLSPAS